MCMGYPECTLDTGFVRVLDDSVSAGTHKNLTDISIYPFVVKLFLTGVVIRQKIKQKGKYSPSTRTF